MRISDWSSDVCSSDLSTLIEPGFIAAYTQSFDTPSGKEDDDDDKRLPALAAGDRVKLADLIADQHFTEPPPRYTEASLVKTLEASDIGRPSTYASIISTPPARTYVRARKRGGYGKSVS